MILTILMIFMILTYQIDLEKLWKRETGIVRIVVEGLVVGVARVLVEPVGVDNVSKMKIGKCGMSANENTINHEQIDVDVHINSCGSPYSLIK